MRYIKDGHKLFEQGRSTSFPLILGGLCRCLINSKMSEAACATFWALGDCQPPPATVSGSPELPCTWSGYHERATILERQHEDAPVKK